MALRLTGFLWARVRVVPRRGRLHRATTRVFASTSGAEAADKIVAPPWKDEVLDSHATLGNVCFVLCAPQGPQNCGATARVMQNFGVYDLRLVNPGPFVLKGDCDANESDESGASQQPPDGANSKGGVNSGAKLGPDGLGFGDELPEALRPTLVDASYGDPSTENKTDSDDASKKEKPLCAEAFRFACAADWLLQDASRHETHLDAIADCTFVMATTARPRGNVPLVTARVAAEMLIQESKRGKVAILFGNERTGLTNDELAQAHACVAIPTAGQGALCRKSLKYTGGTGPTSLNLSQAVGVLAYELFMAADADVVATNNDGNDGDGTASKKRGVASGAIAIPNSQLMTVCEKNTLKNELIGARRTLDVLAGDGGDEEGNDENEQVNDEKENEDDLDQREDRGIERVLNAAPLQRRDAAALFQLARRVKAITAVDSTSDADSPDQNTLGPLDLKVVDVLEKLVKESDKPPSTKKARARVRQAMNLSLTDKEIQRALKRAAQ